MVLRPTMNNTYLQFLSWIQPEPGKDGEEIVPEEFGCSLATLEKWIEVARANGHLIDKTSDDPPRWWYHGKDRNLERLAP